jgi:hypothetical protein
VNATTDDHAAFPHCPERSGHEATYRREDDRRVERFGRFLIG